jgi:hypothetical protein
MKRGHGIALRNLQSEIIFFAPYLGSQNKNLENYCFLESPGFKRIACWTQTRRW